jgi:dsDNA-specific endonuclease/ATPase MutS2
MQASLCAELIKQVLRHSPQLHKAAAAVAELDCLVSFAMCAREYRYTRPVLTTDNVLHIEAGGWRAGGAAGPAGARARAPRPQRPGNVASASRLACL